MTAELLVVREDTAELSIKFNLTGKIPLDLEAWLPWEGRLGVSSGVESAITS